MLILNLNKKVTIMTHNKSQKNYEDSYIIIDKNPETIHVMFNMISKKYDFMNNLMSLGTHNFVKYKSVKNLDIKPHTKIIDLCCGTGDLARIAQKIQPDAIVTGIDFSEEMLKIAKNKTPNGKIQYLQGDITNLPYEDNSFDTVTMGFGLRNILNAEKAVEEIYRILKPNGSFLHLDFGKNNNLGKIYDKLTPNLAKIFTENYFSYEYLIKSKQNFPSPEDLIKDFENKGFKLKKRQDFIFGIISSQIMTK